MSDQQADIYPESSIDELSPSSGGLKSTFIILAATSAAKASNSASGIFLGIGRMSAC
jgi:hypothetical protein